MPEPEISRRCPECGASVKGRAVACPQCGLTFAKGRSAADETAAKEIKAPAQPPPSLRHEADKQMEIGRRKTDSNARQASRPDDFEDHVASVEQRRYDPSVFLGRTGSDSSWRFVVVAAVLFALFLLLFLLSKWLR